MKFVSVIFAILTLCAAAPAWSQSTSTSDLDRLASWMIGSFSSAEQAASDTDFFDIRLQVARIWPTRSDGIWMYVEQATAATIDKPYRQRVYQVRQLTTDLFESRVYTINEPFAMIGAAKDPMRFDQFPLDSLVLRDGCSIVLRKLADSAYVGNTLGKGCESNLRGATYATSEVDIRAWGMTTWDRGYDAADKQVWGAKKSGYIFKKQKP